MSGGGRATAALTRPSWTGCARSATSLAGAAQAAEDTRNPVAIADILGVSVATVRSHLADLFAKSGMSRQAELVARTLSLASPLRPLAPE